jgi:hypothetical protein
MTPEEEHARMMRQIADGLAMVVSAIRGQYGANEIRHVEPTSESEPAPSPFLRRVAKNFGVPTTAVQPLGAHRGETTCP